MECQGVVPRGDNQSTDKDRPAGADEVIGEVASKDAHHVARHGVVAVELSGVFLIPTEATQGEWGDHKEEQDRPHAVVREALPHLGVEEHAEPLGVPGDAAMIALRVPGGGFDPGGDFVHR